MSIPEQADEIRYAVKQRTTLDPSEISPDSLKAADCLPRVCALPADISDRFQYLADALVQMIRDSAKDVDLRICVGRLCESLSYMANSASWRDQTLHQFDREELKRKLRHFA